MDLLCACDIRWSVKKTFFGIKEVDFGLVADVGTFARIHKIVGNESLLREIAYDGSNFGPSKAKEMGFVSRIFENVEEMNAAALEYAKNVASKSQVAVRGIKEMCNFAFDHNVEDCQKHVAVWNGAMLQSEDLAKAAMAFFQKKKPVFSKL